MRTTYLLDQNWYFKRSEAGNIRKVSGLEHGEMVCLPHTWNPDGNEDRDLVQYQHVITIPRHHKEEELFLEFSGANSVCQAYLNGNFLGEHRGGYSSFRFRITDYYEYEKENILTVFVDNRITEDVSPLNGDFSIYGGLYRPVKLICTHKNHFEMEHWGTSGVIIRPTVTEKQQGIVNAELHVVGNGQYNVNVDILGDFGEVVISTVIGADQKTAIINVDNPKLWNGKTNPNLYTFCASLRSEDKIYDQVELKFGFRRFDFSPQTGLLLNGEPFFVRGVAKHQDYEGSGNAIKKQHMEHDIELIREIGANAVLLSHYQYDQYMYDLCDREGLLVWAEIPMLSMPDEPAVLENAENQLRELILQNIHHPSIVFWGIQNEIAMQGESLAMYRGVEYLNQVAHELLYEGITASANMYYVKNASPLNHITDIQGYNLYYGWYYGEIEDLSEWLENFHQDNPDVALGITEYGVDCNPAFHSPIPKVNDYSEEFQAAYHEQTYQIICSKPYLWGSFVWNMFDFGSSVRDEGGQRCRNNKGLITFDRKVKKDAFYYYKASWSDEPFVHICEKRFVNRHQGVIDVKVYSNQEEIVLYVNGKKNAVKRNNSPVFLFPQICLQEGENLIEAVSNEYRDSCVIMKVLNEDLSYVFKDPNPGINVQNWFTQEKGEVDYFPKDYYSILDTLGDLMKNETAWAVVKEMAPKATERASAGAPVTLLWVINKLNGSFKEEDIRILNERLIQIKKTKEN